MLYVISYDVSDDSRRYRVSEALKDFGRWVQYSVFECDLDDEARGQLRARIEAAMDPRGLVPVVQVVRGLPV